MVNLYYTWITVIKKKEGKKKTRSVKILTVVLIMGELFFFQIFPRGLLS